MRVTHLRDVRCRIAPAIVQLPGASTLRSRLRGFEQVRCAACFFQVGETQGVDASTVAREAESRKRRRSQSMPRDVDPTSSGPSRRRHGALRRLARRLARYAGGGRALPLDQGATRFAPAPHPVEPAGARDRQNGRGRSSQQDDRRRARYQLLDGGHVSPPDLREAWRRFPGSDGRANRGRASRTGGRAVTAGRRRARTSRTGRTDGIDPLPPRRLKRCVVGASYVAVRRSVERPGAYVRSVATHRAAVDKCHAGTARRWGQGRRSRRAQ